MPALPYGPNPFAKGTIDSDEMEWNRRPVVSHVLAHLAATRAIRKTHKILDIGCGQGVDLLALAAWGFKDLEGLDYNEAEILTAQAEERKLVQEEVLKKRVIKWRKGSLYALRDVPDGTYDVVFDVFFLSNFPEYEGRILHEVARVLKPGGLYITHLKMDRQDADVEPLAPRLFPEQKHSWTGMAAGPSGHVVPELVLVHILRRATEKKPRTRAASKRKRRA